jgi:hypothetical protein
MNDPQIAIGVRERARHVVERNAKTVVDRYGRW